MINFALQIYTVVVISYGKIREFIDKNPNAADTLNNWYRAVEMADWSNFHEMRNTFNSVDAVGNDRYVFNVGGNNYRVVAMIFFDIRTVFIRFVGRHTDYDKLNNVSNV